MSISMSWQSCHWVSSVPTRDARWVSKTGNGLSKWADGSSVKFGNSRGLWMWGHGSRDVKIVGTGGCGSHGLVVRCCDGVSRSASAERDDAFYMKRCVELAKKAMGFTSPNPMVGCVIVKDGEIVGEGFHPKAGQPHAEVFALKAAGVLANEATAYVSLEPCNHYGRTPPCTNALIQAHVKRVVVGMVDPNPIVASKGVEKLRESGIEVTVGVEEEQCQKLNEFYIHRMLTGKPFTMLRYTQSFGGGFLDQIGEGADDIGGYLSQYLQEYDGVIMFGSESANNGPLLSREIGANQPVQIILLNDLKLPLDLSHYKDASAKTLVFAERGAVHGGTESALKQNSIETVICDQLNISLVLDHCSKLGLCSVLLDFRGNSVSYNDIVQQGMEEGLINKVVMEILPAWKTLAQETSAGKIQREMKLNNVQTRLSKNSVMVEGYVC